MSEPNESLLTLAVSSRALFHIEDGHSIFKNQGQVAFDAYMREKEDIPLRPGIAFSLVKKLLAMNTLPSHSGEPCNRVEVILMSRNSPDAGMRVMNSVSHYGLPIARAVFCQGSDRFRYASAMGTHLFLSASGQDVKSAIDQGLAAATLLPSECENLEGSSEIRLAFDGDAVLFSSESDDVYRKGGLRAFEAHELSKKNELMADGPFKKFLDALHAVQKTFPPNASPLKIALVTARGMPTHVRVIKTLRSWDIRIDECIFAGGTAKGPLLKAFGADLFFDDTLKNIHSAQEHDIPSGYVPFGIGGINN